MGVYSVTDYVIYIFILVVLLFLLRRFLFSLIDLDRNFILLVVTYAFLGIFIRVLADVGFFERSQWWNITPGVYVFSVLIASAGILLGLLLRKYSGIEYWIAPLLVGFFGVFYTGFNLFPYITEPERILYPITLAAAVALFFLLIKVKPFNKIDNVLLVFAHMLDAFSTFIAHDMYGFGEEHLLPIYLIDLAGGSAFVMVPVKLTLILLVIYALEKYKTEEEDEVMYKMLKVLVFILGVGPGTRNTLLPALALGG